ncbi:MAG: phenylalanine--tRNA ligase subunit alpha [Rickettsiales bacterium]|nr:phenylalanine--tRNA ligase subunit alpha [Rickettsiales bacterium]
MSLKRIEEIGVEANEDLGKIENLEQLEQFRVRYLGKKGILSSKMKEFSHLSVDEKKEFGMVINRIKSAVVLNIEEKKQELYQHALEKRLAEETVDISLPAKEKFVGSIHPISHVIEEVVSIFTRLGFSVAEGPDIEDDFHNFTALNIPPNHPAREMQDTFYLESKHEDKHYVLRTHTSPVQIRTMQNGKPPFKIIAPGRVYRSDSDLTHTPMFHQVEGLYIGKDISMAHLKGCVIQFLEAFFEQAELPVRFRPSFFPFTEPSAEVDIGCKRSKEEIKIGAGSDWLEIMGCGMVHPNVLRNVGIDPEEYQGFAFGVGIERIAMLKYGIADLRTFFDSDMRWLKHYAFKPLDMLTLVGGR